MDYEDKDGSRSIRSHDQLNYRSVIQDKIIGYLNAIGTFELEQAVKALRHSVFFEIPGLPFRSEITAKEHELIVDYRDNVKALVTADRDSWIHPIKRALNDSVFKEKFFMDLAKFLLDLIAKHDGLMKVQGIVEIGNTSGVEEGGVKDVISVRKEG